MASSLAGHRPRLVETDSGRRWLERFARLGYASRGVLYLIIGSLAFLSAIGAGGGTTDTRGAVRQIFDAPGGWILVLVVALGLLGHSVWRFCQSVLDADSLGREGKGMVIRGSLLVSSIAHLFLAIWAARFAIGSAGGESSGSNESLVSTLMSQPFGQWIVGLAGVAIIAAGIAQFAKGHRETFEKYFHWNYAERRNLILFCKFGLYARGVIFVIIGGFVLYAAITTDPSEAGGLQEALDWLRSQPFGAWLLGAVSVGLFCFGVYSGVEAVYRRVDPPG